MWLDYIDLAYSGALFCLRCFKQKNKTDSTYSAEPVLFLNHYCHGRPPSFGIKNHSIISLLPSLREDYLTLLCSFISFLLYRV